MLNPHQKSIRDLLSHTSVHPVIATAIVNHNHHLNPQKTTTTRTTTKSLSSAHQSQIWSFAFTERRAPRSSHHCRWSCATVASLSAAVLHLGLRRGHYCIRGIVDTTLEGSAHGCFMREMQKVINLKHKSNQNSDLNKKPK